MRYVAVLRTLLPLAIFIGYAYIGYLLWQTAAEVQTQGLALPALGVERETGMKFAWAIILGITMAHYWVDQHLWKFQTKERRQWLAQNYPFLFPSEKPATVGAAP